MIVQYQRKNCFDHSKMFTLSKSIMRPTLNWVLQLHYIIGMKKIKGSDSLWTCKNRFAKLSRWWQNVFFQIRKSSQGEEIRSIFLLPEFDNKSQQYVSFSWTGINNELNNVSIHFLQIEYHKIVTWSMNNWLFVTFLHLESFCSYKRTAFLFLNFPSSNFPFYIDKCLELL